MHYYKRNLGDYAKKAGRLSMLQHGAYTLLIDACYDREQFPTREDAIEWSWASSSAEIEAVEFVLRKFFVLENGVYVQKRIEEEINEYRSTAETNKRIALERETNRRNKSTNRARTVNEPPPIVNEPPPNQEPLTKNQEPLKIQRKKSAEDFDALGALESLGVNETVAKDFLTIRKKKRAPLTETALDDITREAEKANLSINQVLEKCCARGWQGFEASWMKGGAPPADSQKQINRDNYDRQAREAREKCGKDEPQDITAESSRID